MQDKELKKSSVERTLAIPLWCRALAVKKLPMILPDYDAVRILKEMGEKRPPNLFNHMQCACLAGSIRQYDFSCEINKYLLRHPQATVVELGAGLSCLRRQMKNKTNLWINIDLPDVIRIREKYIPRGDKEKNLSFDLNDSAWMEKIPFRKEDGVIFLAAGVLHYFTKEEVKRLISTMAERFTGGCFVFDIITGRELRMGNRQIRNSGNDARMKFYLDDIENELKPYSPLLEDIYSKSYLEGYPI